MLWMHACVHQIVFGEKRFLTVCTQLHINFYLNFCHVDDKNTMLSYLLLCFYCLMLFALYVSSLLLYIVWHVLPLTKISIITFCC